GHRVAAEDTGQCPIRDAELAEEQRPFDVLGAPGHVGHQERGPDAVGGAVLPEDPPDWDRLLDRHAVVLQLVPVCEAGWEEFGRPLEAVVDRGSELAGVKDDPPIGVFRDGQTDGTVPPRGPRRGPVGHDSPPFLRHRGSWPFCHVTSAWYRTP